MRAGPWIMENKHFLMDSSSRPVYSGDSFVNAFVIATSNCHEYFLSPAHALSLGSYARKSETLILIRASNAASLKYHVKPGDAPTGKTDSTGVLLDAEGKASKYMVKEINDRKAIMKWDDAKKELKDTRFTLGADAERTLRKIHGLEV